MPAKRKPLPEIVAEIRARNKQFADDLADREVRYRSAAKHRNLMYARRGPFHPSYRAAVDAESIAWNAWVEVILRDRDLLSSAEAIFRAMEAQQ